MAKIQGKYNCKCTGPKKTTIKKNLQQHKQTSSYALKQKLNENTVAAQMEEEILQPYREILEPYEEIREYVYSQSYCNCPSVNRKYIIFTLVTKLN